MQTSDGQQFLTVSRVERQAGQSRYQVTHPARLNQIFGPVTEVMSPAVLYAVEATDCVVFVGPPGSVARASDDPTLNLAFPNPFNPATRISYVLPKQDFVKLTVFDVAGRVIERLVSSVQSPGEHVVEWDAKGRPSGIYFYRLEAGDYTQTRKMILLK